MIRITEFRLAFTLLAVAACSGDVASPSQPAGAAVAGSIIPPLISHSDATSASLIECPTNETQSVTARIGPLGGVLALGNTRVVIPLSAVLFPTDFTLTVPASRFVEIEVRAAGTEHYLFQTPIAMTIDYSRCNSPELSQETLSVWNIDPESKALLERMTGVDDKLTHTIVFTTIHLSGYAVAD
jgi:hypothetical protein